MPTDWSEFKARYGWSPSDLVVKGDAGSAAAKLKLALTDCDAAEERFLAEAKRLRSSGQFTEAGVAAQLGEVARRLLGDVTRWSDVGRGPRSPPDPGMCQLV